MTIRYTPDGKVDRSSADAWFPQGKLGLTVELADALDAANAKLSIAVAALKVARDDMNRRGLFNAAERARSSLRQIEEVK